MFNKKVVIIAVIALLLLIALAFFPASIKAEKLERQTAVSTFVNCRISSIMYYPNRDINISGYCKNNYRWYVRYSRFLKQKYHVGDYVTIKGVPSGKLILNPQLYGIGWAW